MNVYQAALQRLEFVFSEFDNVVVAFSGGKDSGVLLNLTADYARTIGRRFSVLHLDYEAQYQATTDYVDSMLASLAPVADIFRCCIPFKVSCATSMHQPYWRPWNEPEKDIWVRELPTNAMTKEHFPFFTDLYTDYEFQEEFATWHHQRTNSGKTCVLTGIRTQESHGRWKAIHCDRFEQNYKSQSWCKLLVNGTHIAHPIYDWATEDIWVANARYGWAYNKLYDLFHFAGLNIHAMRVASPFLAQGMANIHLYRVIEPNTWGRLVSRVNGVNFTAIYGGTTAMGWRKISKPSHFTWKQYCEFLLSTLPKDAAENYKSKLDKSLAFWKHQGGVLPEKAINDLQAMNVPIEVIDSTRSDASAVRMDYIDEIDTPEFSQIPSWKRMCVCILKNDHTCKYMGFTQTKQEIERRKAAINHYQNIL